MIIARIHRQKRKFVTAVAGLETVPDLKIKDCAKAFGKKFASGAAVSDTAGGGKEVRAIVSLCLCVCVSVDIILCTPSLPLLTLVVPLTPILPLTHPTLYNTVAVALQVVIQGDVIYDLPALLVNVFKIPKSVIFFLEDGKLVSIDSKA